MKKWLVKITKWNTRTKQERKEFIIRLSLTTFFLIGGIVVGVVSMYLSGWDFVKFITNPTTTFIVLLCFIMVIILITYRKNKEN